MNAERTRARFPHSEAPLYIQPRSKGHMKEFAIEGKGFMQSLTHMHTGEEAVNYAMSVQNSQEDLNLLCRSNHYWTTVKLKP